MGPCCQAAGVPTPRHTCYAQEQWPPHEGGETTARLPSTVHPGPAPQPCRAPKRTPLGPASPEDASGSASGLSWAGSPWGDLREPEGGAEALTSPGSTSLGCWSLGTPAAFQGQHSVLVHQPLVSSLWGLCGSSGAFHETGHEALQDELVPHCLGPGNCRGDWGSQWTGPRALQVLLGPPIP